MKVELNLKIRQIKVNETTDEPGGDSSSESEEFFDFESNLWQSDVFNGKIQKDPC